MTNTKLSILALSAVLALAAFFLHLHEKFFPSWDEDVPLSDGRVLRIHRAQEFNTDGSLIETELSFNLPETGPARIWREALHPVIVDLHDGKVYVVGHVTYKSAWKYKDPKYGYVAFTLSPGGWQRVPFISLPEVVRSSENIAYCTRAIRTLEAKQTGWCNFRGDFVPGLSRKIDLAARGRDAQEMAELARTTTKSE